MTIDQATEAATLSSRQYAKRQRTWFRSNMKAWRQVFLP
jgi:tRNA dimethylallyltransferase